MTVENEDLDSYCKKILMTLMESKKEYGFGKLAHDLAFSRPTLTSHLNHLLKMKLLVKRIDATSKLHMKPSYYSLNYKGIGKYFRKIQPNFAEDPMFRALKKLGERLDKADFQELAWEILRYIYLGDMVMTKLLLVSLKQGGDREELIATKRFMSVTLDMMLARILKMSKTMKNKEIETVIKEFDEQIERVDQFFKTGSI